MKKQCHGVGGFFFSFPLSNLRSLSVPGIAIGMCWRSWIPCLWVFTVRWLCGFEQVFIITVFWFINIVTNRSLGRWHGCPITRIFQSCVRGNVTGRTYCLRSRHEDIALQETVTDSTVLAGGVEIGVGRGRIGDVGIFKCAAFHGESSVGHSWNKHGFQVICWHLPA